MALFGVTRHGDYNQLLNSQPVHKPSGFDAIPDATFETEFEKYVIGECAEAECLQVWRVHAALEGSLLPECSQPRSTHQIRSIFPKACYTRNSVGPRASQAGAGAAERAYDVTWGVQVDGSSHILRKSLLDILRNVLGRDPVQHEFDIFFTCAFHTTALPHMEAPRPP